MVAMLAELDKHYEKHPVVLIIQADNRAMCIDYFKVNKWRFAEGGAVDVLAEIRSWDYGVLMITREEGRGVDTRFRKDAIVLVVDVATNYHEL